MSTNAVQPQKSSRSRNLMIIVVALGVIALLSAIGLLTTSFGLGRSAFTRGNLPNNSQGGNFQGGNGNPQTGNGGNFQRRGGATGIFSMFGLIGIGLTVLATVFVWKRKRWALKLAIVLAILFLLGSLPGFFNFSRFFSVITVLTSSANILKGLATLPIIVLGILPSVRDSFS